VRDWQEGTHLPHPHLERWERSDPVFAGEARAPRDRPPGRGDCAEASASEPGAGERSERRHGLGVEARGGIELGPKLAGVFR